MKIIATVFAGVVLFAGVGVAAPLSRWEESGPPYPVIYSIAVAQDGSDTLYAAASDVATAQSAVFRSEDAGATWTLLASALPGDTAASIAIDPRDPKRLFTTAFRQENGFSTRLYVSADSGITWHLGGDVPLACGGTFAFDTSDPLAVYVNMACSGELLASHDAGLTWETRNSSLGLLRSGPGGELYAVRFGEGIVFSGDGGHSWVDLGAPPCPYFGEGIHALAVDPVGRLYVGTGHIRMMFVVCPGLFQSSDGGFTWTEISRGEINPLYVTEILIDLNEPSRLYAATFLFGLGDVFASVDGGNHWRALGLPAPAYVLALSTSGDLLFAVTEQGLYRLSIRKTRVVPSR